MLSTLTSLINEWIPWLLLASFPSALNLMIANSSLQQESKQLPFFKPHTHWGFWFWCLVQFFLPAIAFWYFFSIDKKPPIDLGFYIKAGLFGIGFITFVNGSVPVGPTGFNIKALYDAFVRIGLEMILTKEAARTTEFWTVLTDELKNGSVDFEIVFNYLTQAVRHNSTFNGWLKDDARDKLVREHDELIAAAKRKRDQNKKAEATVNAIKQIVRREALPDALKTTGCTKTLNQFFKKKP